MNRRDRAQADTIPGRVWIALAAAAALVHGTLWWIYYRPLPKVLWGDEATYWRSAMTLLSGDSGWRPDPLWPPLYPQFLAGIAALGGPTVLWVQVVQTGLLFGAALVLADVTRRLSGSRIAAAAAGSLTVLYPPLVAFAHYLWPEVLHLFLFVALVWVLMARSERSSWCAVAGVVAGLALLTKSLLGPFMAVLFVAAFARRPIGASLARGVVFAAAVAATIAPTVVEQHRRTGRLMIADSSAFNLWVGLNDRARRNFEIDVVSGVWREYEGSAATFEARDRILRDRIRSHLDSHSWVELVRRQLGRQYFRLFDRDSYLTDQLPGGAAVERYGAGYLEAGSAAAGALRSSSYLSYAALLAAAPLGLAVWRYRDRRWMAVLLAFVGYNLAIFLWLHVKSRYRLQLLPVAFVGVGGAVAWVAAVAEGDRAAADIPRWRWLIAGACVALLEFLAFAGRLLP
jgi:4-amino-4-deoxy-L-arabinose transferase-like glycosyltransferase